MRLLMATSIVFLLACGEDTAGPPEPASIELVSGGSQRASVTQPLPEPVVFRVLDAAGGPVVAGDLWLTVESGFKAQLVLDDVTHIGSLENVQASTDSDGMVRVEWILGEIAAEPQRLRASFLRTPLTPDEYVVAEAMPDPGDPTVFATSGDVQEAPAGETLPNSVVVRVFDQYGNRVPGVPVSWSDPSDGMLVQASQATDGHGEASARWMLGASPGVQELVVQVGTLGSVTFTAVAQAS